MKKKNQIKSPNAFLYCVVYILVYPVLKVFFRLKVDRSVYRRPKGPFIVFSNHQSFMDFLLVMLTIYPVRLNAVAAQKFFFYRPLDKLMPYMGCIPKNLFDPDPRSIRGMLTVIRRGGRLLVFPEGRCSTDGVYAGMHKATGKLVKKLNVPVVCCHIEGSYTCMPFWRKGVRTGRERVTITNILTAEETRTLTVDEINSRIDGGLSGKYAAPVTKPFTVFREKRLAEGLHNILYYCPCCESEFALETRGNTIRCTDCGCEALMGRDATFEALRGGPFPETVHKWYKAQVEYELRFIHKGMEPINTKVNVRMPLHAGEGLTPCGQGDITLDEKGWHFTGELSGEDVRLFFPVETVPAIPFDPDDNFQIYSNGNFYVFTPADNPRACAKYAVLGECAYWRFAVETQMTRGHDCGFSDVQFAAVRDGE